ncbi:MAG: hypothetical protein LUD72_02830 [Bacteroidales bacterium]|nr:hypothetical protein [Bacteroidales bacterium]
MKKIPSIFLALVFALAVISCSDDDYRVYSTSINIASITVPCEGGSFSVGYTVTNSKTDGYVAASTEDEWISDIDLSLEDTVSFSVEAYFERVSRSGEIVLNYIDGSDTLNTRSLRITQEYYNLYLFEGVSASGMYYGMSNLYNSEGVGQYSLYISDVEIDEYGTFEKGATYYFIDLWTNAALDGVEFVSLPEGEYVFGQAGENFTVTGDSEYFVMSEGDDEYNIYSDEDYFYDGSVTVTRSGDITTISGTLEDGQGGIHEFSYSGELAFENVGLMSSLEEDEDVGDFSDVDCVARYYGDYYQTGTANWMLCIYPEVGTGFVIDISADASYDMDGGLPVGTFTVSTNGGVLGTFFNGVLYRGYVSGTWLLTFDEDGALTAPYAPIDGGTIEISASGDSYTITIDGVDDRENSVTGTWTGTPTISDYRTSTTALGSRKHHSLMRF